MATKRTVNEVRTDLLLIKSLAQSLKSNPIFHNSLDAQAQAVIDKINLIDYDLANLPFAEESEVEGTEAKLNPETGKIERVPVPKPAPTEKEKAALKALPLPPGAVARDANGQAIDATGKIVPEVKPEVKK